jgi:hypothetical protein
MIEMRRHIPPLCLATAPVAKRESPICDSLTIVAVRLRLSATNKRGGR